MPIQIKRIYEPYQATDGIRILVDKLWPRGISKERAKLDAWQKSLTPSSDLRVWFGHKEERFIAFKKKYIEELNANPDALRIAHEILMESKDKTVTLLYAAKDPKINHAIILKEYLDNLPKR